MKKSWWPRLTTSTVKFPLALMTVVPIAIMCGYGRKLVSNPEAWSTPAPMLLGLMMIGLLTVIAGVHVLVDAAWSRGSR